MKQKLSKSADSKLHTDTHALNNSPSISTTKQNSYAGLGIPCNKKRKLSDVYDSNEIPLPLSAKRHSHFSLNDTRKSSSGRKVSQRRFSKKKNMQTSFNDTSLQISYNGAIGIIWSNNSCAFDAVLMVLRLIWVESKYSGEDYVMLPDIMDGFQRHHLGLQSLESIRDSLRQLLNRQRPSEFTFGAFCSVTALLEELLKLNTHLPFMSTKIRCDLGHMARRHPRNLKHSFLEEHRIILPVSTREWIGVNRPAPWNNTCNTCNAPLKKYFHIESAPKILAFSCEGRTDFCIDRIVQFKCNSVPVCYSLRGVIYYLPMQSHFICRMINKDNEIVIHDGMQNSGCTSLESLDFHDIDWLHCLSGIASAAIYLRSDNALCVTCASTFPCHCN